MAAVEANAFGERGIEMTAAQITDAFTLIAAVVMLAAIVWLLAGD